MNIETLRSRLKQVEEQRWRAGTSFWADAGVFASGLLFGDIFYMMGRIQPEVNPFAGALAGVSVVAAGAALWRLRQAIVTTRQRDNLWKEERELFLRNRPSTLPPNSI